MNKVKGLKKHLNVLQETAYAEFGSALEMLSACKLSKKDSFCFGYFHHSKDEYNQKYKGQNIQGPYFWHVDHTAGLVNLHILLEDIDNTCTHMQFLSKSNKYSNTRDLYSDETVKHSGHEVVDCIGKKGSIYFHNGNTLHRVVGKKNSSRLGLIFSFSTGSNIEFNCKNIFNGYSSSYDLKKMEKRKRNILKGLFPFEGVKLITGMPMFRNS